ALTTAAVYDDQGRMTKLTEPSSKTHYFGYFANRNVTVPNWSGSAAQAPIQVTEFNNGDQVTDEYAVDPSQMGLTVTVASDQVTAFSGDTQAMRVRWSHVVYDS